MQKYIKYANVLTELGRDIENIECLLTSLSEMFYSQNEIVNSNAIKAIEAMLTIYREKIFELSEDLTKENKEPKDYMVKFTLKEGK